MLIEERYLAPVGVAGRAAHLFLFGNRKKAKNLFFKPYQGDAWKRFGSIFTAPIAFACMLFICVDHALFCGLLAIENLLLLQFSNALACLKDTGSRLDFHFFNLVLVVLSPIINLVDFIAGALAKPMEPSEETKSLQL